MQEDLLVQAEGYALQARKRRVRHRVMTVLASIVVFCTAYALVLPAITVQGPTCDIAEHEHSSNCYVRPAAVPLTCDAYTASGHAHTPACYDALGELACGQADYVIHTHNDLCFDARGELVCRLPQVEAHVHGPACYVETVVETPAATETPGATENPGATEPAPPAELHAHTDACYEEQRGELTCTEPEVAAHAHGDACYSVPAVEPTVVTAPHMHTDACYAALPAALVCGLEEWPGHAHGDACWAAPGVPSCGLSESAGHLHAAELGCFDAEGGLVCPVAEGEGAHYHGDACWAPVFVCAVPEGEGAHFHGEGCWADQGFEVVCGLEEGQEVVVEVLEPAEPPAPELTCVLAETEGHAHDDACYEMVRVAVCGLEEGQPVPGTDAGAPGVDDAVSTQPEGTEPVQPKPPATPEPVTELVLVCTLPEHEPHVHGDACYVLEAGVPVLVCAKAQLVEHVHGEACLPAGEPVPADDVLTCALEESEDHLHGQLCYGAWGLVCTFEEHAHGLGCYLDESSEEYARVQGVTELIEALPTNEQIEAELRVFEEAEDTEGYEAYWLAVLEQSVAAYKAYDELGPELQEHVANAQKLLALEWLYSAATLELTDEDAEFAPEPKPAKDNSAQLTVLGSADTSGFVALNLYDYNAGVNGPYIGSSKYPGFAQDGGTTRIDDVLTAGSFNFGNSFTSDLGAGVLGVALGSGINAMPYGATTPVAGAMYPALVDGYPALADGTSLAYLFSNSGYAARANGANANGLFRYDPASGAYFFNSRATHAQFNAWNSTFTLYGQVLSPNFVMYPYGSFLPFNNIAQLSMQSALMDRAYFVQIARSAAAKATSEDDALATLAATLADFIGLMDANCGTAWTAYDVLNAYHAALTGTAGGYVPGTEALGTVYTVDYDEPTNFFFGMDMQTAFVQPKGGMAGSDVTGDGTPDYPMQFFFEGNDDVWVYVDGVLFLDLSGIHEPVAGLIDFSTGLVSYYANGSPAAGAAGSPYASYTFAQLLAAAGLGTDVLNEYGTFTDYSSHTLSFYYVQREAGSSMCNLSFNFPLLEEGMLAVGAELVAETPVLGDPDRRFQVLAVAPDGTKTNDLFIPAGTGYDLYSLDGAWLGAGTTDAYGVLTLKAGQRAEFYGIPQTAGSYYVRELFDPATLGQYAAVAVNGVPGEQVADVLVGSSTLAGVDAPVRSAGEGSAAFVFTAAVDAEKLGTLAVSKAVAGLGAATPGDARFAVEVALNGAPLPAGTRYLVGEEERLVETPGTLVLAAGETALVEGILAGTTFTVRESEASAAGYHVTYEGGDEGAFELRDGAAAGAMPAQGSVAVTVRSEQKGATVQIPGTAALHAYDGLPHACAFVLEEVADALGTELAEGGLAPLSASVEVTEGPAAFAFTLNYVQAELGELPATRYYRVRAAAAPGDASMVVDARSYVAEVTLAPAADPAGEMTAQVTGLWCDGVTLVPAVAETPGLLGDEVEGAGEPALEAELPAPSADFTNTLVGELEVSLTAVGVPQGQAFAFEVALAAGQSGLAELPAAYDVTLFDANGNEATVQVAFEPALDRLVHTFPLAPGERVRVHGLPYGSSWRVVEMGVEEYRVSTSVRCAGASTYGSAALTSGSVVVGETLAAYMNNANYELPKTGGSGDGVYRALGALLVAVGFLALTVRVLRRERGLAD